MLIRHPDSARGNDLYGPGAIVRVPHRSAPATGVAHTLHRDYETRSNANLPKVGVDKYAADPFDGSSVRGLCRRRRPRAGVVDSIRTNSFREVSDGC